jgi:hypothetical protein
MGRRFPALFAWFLCGCSLMLVLGYIPLRAAQHQATFMPGMTFSPDAIVQMQMSLLDLIIDIVFFITVLSFSTLGALVIARQPGNRVGWIFCGVGFTGALTQFAAAYAIYSLVITVGALPGGLAMGWLQSWLWLMGGWLLVVFLPLLYPNGQPLSRAWRLVTWLAAASLALVLIWIMVLPGQLVNSLIPFHIPNPLGIQGPGFVEMVIGVAIVALFLGTILAGASSLILRLHRSKGVERQQVKWFAYFGALLCVLSVLNLLIDSRIISVPVADEVRSIASAILTAALPIATGLAILRYRLYDIDIIIRKTLTYALVVGVLVVVYFGTVILLQQLFANVTGQRSEVITVLSTLVIAAMFVPLRDRIQATIDKRFYRKKYDAQKVLAKFGETVRDETDLEKLTANLIDVVNETMQPKSVSVWLKK